MSLSSVTQLSTFAADVNAGLSGEPKFLSSKYFYDDEGSHLFQQIMQLPEYYLTRVEQEIFETQVAEIHSMFTGHKSEIDLIELGAGDGSKTAVLIEHFLQESADFTYSPIDISQEAVDQLTSKFRQDFPALKMQSQTGDYFRILESLKTASKRRKVLLFLGSNIGNFSRTQALGFFQHLREVMNSDDLLFIGFDLQKDPRLILQAYDDSQGVTAAFNLNLLHRINRQLGANFDVRKFSHYASYHPIEASARSFLISQEEHDVLVGALNRKFHFNQWEPIFMEISQKYNLEMIADLAQASGFQVAKNFFDRNYYFADSLWRIA